MEGKYTLDDIARELGVSKTTVSRAISGKGRVSARTRERVREFIGLHGFRPNAVAKSLAQSRTHNLALLLPGGDALDFSFFQQCLQGICDVASQNDHDVLLTMDESQLERVVANGKADGVIAARSEVDSAAVGLLKAKGIPFVVIGRTRDPDVAYVDNDNRAACRAMTGALLDRGLRRLALLSGDENHAVTRSRREGFLDACRAAGVPESGTLLLRDVTGADRAAAAVDSAAAWGADCIVCMDDRISAVALARLDETGISVPGDVRLASFYDSPVLECVSPPVTSLRFDGTALGREACRALLALLEGGETSGKVLPGYRIMERASTR